MCQERFLLQTSLRDFLVRISHQSNSIGGCSTCGVSTQKSSHDFSAGIPTSPNQSVGVRHGECQLLKARRIFRPEYPRSHPINGCWTRGILIEDELAEVIVPNTRQSRSIGGCSTWRVSTQKSSQDFSAGIPTGLIRSMGVGQEGFSSQTSLLGFSVRNTHQSNSIGGCSKLK